jgi:6-phosphogluconate dehydrogenase
MPGGSAFAYNALRPILEAMSAKVDGEPCVTHVGPEGAGHYSKMVHNGIEYADMQFIAECYDMLRHICGFTNDGIADTFDEWNTGPLESFLIEATAKVLRKKDDVSGEGFLVDKILDQAGSKGTGKWTVQLAADSGIAVPSCSAALEARFVSAQREIRVKCDEVYGAACTPRRSTTKMTGAERGALVEKIAHGLHCAKVLAYAQGFSVLTAASKERGWDMKMGELARIWRGGCIIRARLLSTIIEVCP